jgi:hypothetical protein
MDPLSITASVIAVIEITRKAIEFLDAIKNGPRECRHLRMEISNLYYLLNLLQGHFDGSTEACLAAPLKEYEESLEELLSKVLKQERRAITWSFAKKEVERTLVRIERLKSLLDLSLDAENV